MSAIDNLISRRTCPGLMSLLVFVKLSVRNIVLTCVTEANFDTVFNTMEYWSNQLIIN